MNDVTDKAVNIIQSSPTSCNHDFSKGKVDSFWEKVDIRSKDECWKWKASRPGGNAYGGFRASGHHYQAHRFAFIVTIGPIPDGMFVCHKCDNPPCCNPDHLFVGTRLDNIRDMVSKGRHRFDFGGIDGKRRQRMAVRRGKDSHLAKVTEEIVSSIRKEYKKRVVTYNMLGDKYGLCSGAIKAIVRRLTWTHIP